MRRSDSEWNAFVSLSDGTRELRKAPGIRTIEDAETWAKSTLEEPDVVRCGVVFQYRGDGD